jgi:subtilase family serine protease
MFRPTQSDLQAIIDFVKSKGLTVTGASPDRMSLGVRGTVKDIQKIFHIHCHYYRLENGKEISSPDREPSIDLDVPILQIDGLVYEGPPQPAGK